MPFASESDRKPLFQQVTIAGLGLIGGSLALDLRAKGLAAKVVGLELPEPLAVARARGIVDQGGTDPAEAVPGADLLVLAVPVRAIVPLAERCLPYLKPGAVVTDVGSVKTEIVKALGARAAFVGAHPVAGAERSGPAAAQENLFQGAACILTPTAETPPAAVDRIEALWQGVGMWVERMAPERHDEIVAAVSHLPHLLAFALTQTVAHAGGDVHRYGAGSLRDGSRVAASSVTAWVDILLTNAANVDKTLETFGREIERLRAAIGSGDEGALRELLTAAGEARRTWFAETAEVTPETAALPAAP